MSATQQVTATIEISGPQNIDLDTHGMGRGSHIRVTTGRTIVTMLDVDAVKTYVGAWMATCDLNRRLPPASLAVMREISLAAAGNTRTDPYMKASGPALGITARGSDTSGWGQDPRTYALTVKIGAVRWIVVDREAHQSMLQAYAAAARAAAIVLPDPRSHT